LRATGPAASRVPSGRRLSGREIGAVSLGIDERPIPLFERALVLRLHAVGAAVRAQKDVARQRFQHLERAGEILGDPRYLALFTRRNSEFTCTEPTITT